VIAIARLGDGETSPQLNRVDCTISRFIGTIMNYLPGNWLRPKVSESKDLAAWSFTSQANYSMSSYLNGARIYV
jgi:hypothetical protein